MSGILQAIQSWQQVTSALNELAECFDGAAKKIIAANMDRNLAASGVHVIDVQASEGMGAGVALVFS
jgi:hypothetical protein